MNSYLARLRSRAAAGDRVSQCRLANRHMARKSMAGYRKALPWLRRAAASGDSWAEYHLGLIYDCGLAGQRDIRRAADWYERSAKKGFASARLNLGIILAHRRGPRRDLRRAMHLYRLAARQGRAHAAYNLGLYYIRGRGVRRNRAAALRWYRRAAELGDREAFQSLHSLRTAPNNAMNLPVRPVTRLAVLAPPRISSKGGGQGARPSRPAGYRER